MPPATLPQFDLRGWSLSDIADPYPVYQRYRELAAVHRSTSDTGGPDTFYVFSCDEVHSVLTSRQYGRSASAAAGDGAGAPVALPDGHRFVRSLVENWLVFMDPPRHTDLRSLLSPRLSPPVVTGLRPRIAAIARDLVARLDRRREIDLVEGFAAPLPVLVVAELLGVTGDDHEWLRARSVALQGASSSRGGTDGHERAETAARELTEYFREEVHRRRRDARDDLLTLLVHAERDGAPLEVEEIVGTCVHLLTAGHETTTHFLSKAALALRRHPGLLTELRQNPDLFPQAVEELLRHDPPVQAVTRWAYTDDTVGGLHVPRGSRVVALLGSAARDPAHVTRPDVLDPHRPPARQLAFGLGIHYCLGATLARAEAEIGLAALLDGLPDLDRGTQDVVYADDLVFHGPSRLILGPTSREPDHDSTRREPS